MTNTEQPTGASPGDRCEAVVLVAIVIAVGAAAGAASFTHVKDWTLDNSPPGTGVWFGWANAVISELVPVAALLTIRRRKRTGAPIGYPIFLLLAAGALSLAAQLAVAKPGPSGWLLSAVPALAFMALVKLILAPVPTAHTSTPTFQPTTAGSDRRPPADIDSTTPSVDDSTPVAEVVPAVAGIQAPAHLMTPARFAAAQHEQHTGQPITADELGARLSLTPDLAHALLTQLGGQTTTTPARINGARIPDGAR